MVAHAIRDIAASEEITVKYGSEWFRDSCPCIDCTSRTPSANNPDSYLELGPPTNPALFALRSRRIADLAQKDKDGDIYRRQRAASVAAHAKSHVMHGREGGIARDRRRSKGRL